MKRDSSIMLRLCTLLKYVLLVQGMSTSTLSAAVLEWTRWQRTAEEGYGRAVAADEIGNIFISGHIGGNPSAPAEGDEDVFVSRYDAMGNHLWTRQLGTAHTDESWGVAPDRRGNVYVSGFTDGSLGGPAKGSWDAFLCKLDIDGNVLWQRQLGTKEADIGQGGVAVDERGDVYISGATNGKLGDTSFGQSDVFVAKYDSSGSQVWIRQFGSSSRDVSLGVAADQIGSVYIAGHTRGGLAEGRRNYGGDEDVFLAKYSSDGKYIWARQLGTGSFGQSGFDDVCWDVAADKSGNVFVVGWTEGNLGGRTAVNSDVYVSKYNSDGALVWTRTSYRTCIC